MIVKEAEKIFREWQSIIEIVDKLKKIYLG